MDPRGHREAAALAITLLSAILACRDSDSQPSRRHAVTPWFEVERVQPWLTIPDLLAFGPEERAYVLRNGSWQLVYEGERSYATPLDAGKSVLIRSKAAIHSATSNRIAVLPKLDCGGHWFRHVLVAPDLDRVLCVQASRDRGCGRIRIAQFDSKGTLVRRDELGPTPSCVQVQSNEDYNTHFVTGVTPAGDPVLAAQVGKDERGSPRYVVLVLGPTGVREIGHVTAMFPSDLLENNDTDLIAAYGGMSVLNAF